MFWAFLPLVSAATLDVCDSGCTYPDITSALADAAASGDEIVVSPGSYVGTLTIRKDITLRSVGGSAVTSIVPNGGNHAVNVVDEAVVYLEGFEVEPANHRAVHVDEAVLFVTDLLVQNATGRHGVGIDVRDGELTVVDSVFRNLTSTQDGACAHGHGEGSLTLQNVVCDGMTALRGGAVAVVEEVSLDIDGLRVSNATADEGGSLFSQTSADILVRNSDFDGASTSGSGGHVRLLQVGDARFESTRFAHGEGRRGGAIHAPSMVELVDIVFEDNAANNQGGAVWIGGGALVQGVVFQRNTSGVKGGALHVDGGTVEVVQSVLCGNSGPNAGGIFIDATATVSLDRTVLVENTATNNGGGILNEGSLSMAESDFLHNTASSGGAVRSSGSLQIDHTLFSGNGSHAVHSTGSFSADWSAWYDNTPDDLGGTLGPADRGPNVVEADPMLSGYSPDGDCSNDAFVPDSASPLVDGGDPALQDPDGSPRDIGAFGGDGPVDLDGDGSPAGEDCDDTEPLVAPTLPETCGDGLDNDCDGTVDCDTWWLDQDGDGFGDPGTPEINDQQPPGTVSNDLDCDDQDANVSPDASEVCDGRDSDCNGVVDDGLPTSSWFEDLDQDGWGAGTVVVDCDQPDGHVDSEGDCNDQDAAINPSEPEVWYDGVDADCDGNDSDQDEDGFLADVVGGDDCDDLDPQVGPGPCDPEVEPPPDALPQVITFGVAGKRPAGCGCQLSGGAGGPGWALLSCFLWLSRRRKP